MTITDPTAIPTTDAEITEYMHEADQLWNAGRTEEAHTLYRSVFASVGSGQQASLARYRIALYLQSIDRHDEALVFAAASDEPGAHELALSLRGAMPDEVVNPSVPPHSTEACERYVQATMDAAGHGDWTTVEALTAAYQQTSIDVGVGAHASNQMRRGEALVHLGRSDEARPALEWAIANTNSDPVATQARALLQQIGVQVQDGGNPYQTDDSELMLAGIAAFERGDALVARTELQAVVDSTSAGPIDKARAHFYLGSMSYHEHRFDEARTHLHIASTDAPHPEQGWAVDMLAWRWQEST